MHLALSSHPETPPSSGLHIEVDAARSPAGVLTLHYVVNGRIGDLIVPPAGAPKRADLLWQHTCFEVFVRGLGETYYEFNFSPSTEWAAYRFDSYRAGMKPAELAAPSVKVQSSADQLELTVQLDLGTLADIARASEWRTAVSAVIEETGGRKSYWALKHPPGKPDFHNTHSFACTLLP